MSSFPRRRESTAGKRRWVPVSTGTTVSGGAPMARRRESTGASRGFPSPRERRWAAAHLCRHSREAGIHGGGRRRLHGNDGERRHTHIVIPAQAGIHGGEAAMGSRLHGNDGGRRHRRHSRAGGNPIHGVIPRGGRRWVQEAAMGSRLHGNDGERRRTYVVIPAQAGIHGGGAAMGSRLHGNDGGRRRTYVVIPAQAGIHGGGSGDGFPSPRERR